MSVRQSSKYKISLWLLTLLCLGGAGYLGYRTFFATGSSVKELKAAEDAYARGLDAYKNQKWGDAVTRFDEAVVLADRAMDAVKAEAEAGKGTPDEATKMVGRINWLRAQAIRDHAYAQSHVDNKPITDATDPQYNNEKFRAFGMIPNDDERKKAVEALRSAAYIISSDPDSRSDPVYPDVVKECLRLELVRNPIDWGTVEPLLRKSIELDEKDARAHFFLARYEFDQPDPRGNPIAPQRKSSDRVEKARQHLAKVRESNSPYYWRTAGLEAEILDWPILTAKDRKLKPDDLAKAEQRLDTFLFDPQTGAVAMAGRGEKLTNLGVADGKGLAGVLGVGFERAAAEAQRPGGNPERIRIVSQAALDLSNKMLDDPAMKPFAPDVLLILGRAASQSQRFLAQADANGWQRYIKQVEAVIRKAGETVKVPPQVFLDLAEVNYRDAVMAMRGSDLTRAKELADLAVKQAETGLKAAEEAKRPTAEIDLFHERLADWKLHSGMKAEAVEPHLARLRASTVPRCKLVGQFLDAVVAERQGRLDKARRLLQPLANEKSSGNLTNIAVRANLLLANLNLVLGDPAAALVSLKEVEPIFRTLDELPPIDRNWVQSLGGTLESLITRQVGAHLDVALRIVAHYRKDNPGKPIPGEQTAGSELAAQNLLKRLPPRTPADRTARLLFVNYLALTNRREAAIKLLGELSTEYPDSVEVLRTQCMLTAAPKEPGSARLDPNGVAGADKLIDTFLKNYPANRAAQLFKAEWLMWSGRADKAADYLKDPTVFPVRDATLDRLLAYVLHRSGQHEEARKVSERVPDDGSMGALIIQVTGSSEANAKIRDRINSYEDQGLIRVYEASLRLAERTEASILEAIKGFDSALEFTKVTAIARNGIQQAVVALADVNPAKAREMAVELAAKMPDVPGLYLAAADAALVLDDIGEPTDKWELTRTAWAALNRWEAAVRKAGSPNGDIAMVKVQFRILTGDIDGARREAATANVQNPDHVPTILALAELALLPPVDVERARKFYDQAVQKSPTDARLPYLDARILRAAGDLPKAIAVYERLVTESPRNATPYQLLISALSEAGKNEEALRRAREWQAKLPDDPRATTEVIRLLALDGKKPEAVKAADEFVARHVAEVRKRAKEANPPPKPEDAEKAENVIRAAALFATATGFFRAKAYDEAETRVQEALKYQPTSGSGQLLLGDIAIARQNWDKARQLYAALVKDSPRHFVAGNNLAWILAEKMGKPDDALHVVEEVRKGRNGVKPVGAERLPADFLDTIGVVYMKLNDPTRFTEMKRLFDTAVRRYPTDPRMFLYLGHAQAATGEKSKAKETFGTAKHLAGLKNGLPDDQKKAVIDAADEAIKKLGG